MSEMLKSESKEVPVTMFETSASTIKLDEALAKAQSEVQSASKDTLNPHFGKRYADLAAVWDACRPALTKNGISVTQWPLHSLDNRLHLITRIAHSGEWMRAEFSTPVPKQDPQGYGSALTYLKRYSLSAVIGVVADEDDDGNAAGQVPRARVSEPVKQQLAPVREAMAAPRTDPSKPAPQEHPATSALSEKQVKRAYAIGNSKGWSGDEVKAWMRSKFGVESVPSLDRNQYDALCAHLEKGPQPDFAPPSDGVPF